jgi:hypothetical protein
VSAEVRRLFVAVAAAAAFGLVHEIGARVLAGHDVLGAVLNRFDAVTLLLALVVAFTRPMLLFFVPGWLAYRIVRVLSAARARSKERTFSGAETSARRA